MDDPRAYTTEEARDMFLRQVAQIVKYWGDDARTPTVRGKLEGIAFSMLTALDGGSIGLPRCAIVPLPHEEDEAYLRSVGENFHPYVELPEGVPDIGGALHERIHEYFQDLGD